MSDIIDTYQYLQQDFDPQVLKVAELRRVFLELDIDFKSAAKKAELIQIFYDEVRPRAAQILAKATNPSRSSNKIERVGDASPVVLPMTTPRRGPGRPRKHPLPEDDAPQTVKKAASEMGTARKSVGRPRKLPKLEDDVEPPLAAVTQVRKNRKKTADFDNQSNSEDDEETTQRKTEKRSHKTTFSSSNPFQSASPPADTSPSKRRQTTSNVTGRKPAASPSVAHRRTTEVPMTPSSMSSKADTDDFKFNLSRLATAPKASTPFRKGERFMPPMSSLKASPAFQSAAERKREDTLAAEQILSSREDNLEGEAFASDKPKTVNSTKRALARRSAPGTLKRLLSWLPIVGLAAGSAYGANWYRDAQLRAGYCGVDSIPISIQPNASELDRLVQLVHPRCVPCPPHAICRPGFKMICDDEFVKIDHPLSLSGLIPISPRCAPDTEKLRRIQVVATEIIQTLRDRTANAECGYSTGIDNGQVGLSAPEIRELLMTRKSPTITPEHFDTLFEHAIEEIKTRDEIEVSSSKPTQEPTYEGLGVVDHHTTQYYHSTSLANIGLKCRLRRDFLSVLARYRVELIGLLTLSSLVLYLRRFFKTRSIQKQRVQELVARVYDELSSIKARAIDQPRKYDPHLGVSQLRDSLLADEFSYAQRERLWYDVQSIVETNSNVRATQAEIQGEWLRAWEWVGAVHEVTEEDRRRSQGLYGNDEFVRPVV